MRSEFHGTSASYQLNRRSKVKVPKYGVFYGHRLPELIGLRVQFGIRRVWPERLDQFRPQVILPVLVVGEPKSDSKNCVALYGSHQLP